MDVRNSDVGTSGAEQQSENAATRALILAGLNIKWFVGDLLSGMGSSRARRRAIQNDPEAFPASQEFSELPAYTSIIKHRSIADRFNFTDPFYRCHDRSRGAITTIDGQDYVNFASYDYLGLNGHPDGRSPRRRRRSTSTGPRSRPAASSPASVRCTATSRRRSPTSTSARMRSCSSAVTPPTSRPSARCSVRATSSSTTS